MNYRMPDYYSGFRCIADKCPDTCCAGWEIVIDEKTMNKYKTMNGASGEYIRKNVNMKEQVYKRCGNRCAFLNGNNLCDLYINAGEDKLCKTCDRYPRHFEEYGDLVEAALSISCPVAAEMIIDREGADRFLVNKNNKKSPHSGEVDEALLKILIKIRKVIFFIVGDRKKSIDERMRKILELGDEIQPLLYKYERRLKIWKILGFNKDVFSGITTVLTKYNIDLKNEKNNGNISNTCCEKEGLQKRLESYCDIMLGLEKINDNWDNVIGEIKSILCFGLTKDNYIACRKEFFGYMKSREYEYEHILNYFIYTYFLGGVYDYNISAMIKLSVVSTLFVREMGLAKWMINGKHFTVEEQIKVAYTYSRQIEHSDNNLLCLEGLMTAHPVFATEKINSLLM